MSLSTTARRSFSSTARASYSQASSSGNPAASSSTQAVPKNRKRQHTLPREKLRALIALYHQSDTFITQDNLVEKINEALLPKLKADRLGRNVVKMPTHFDLERILSERTRAPKIAGVAEIKRKTHDLSKGDVAQWSGGARSKRESRVIEALYGVNMSGGVKPGLETVEAVLEQEGSQSPSQS